MVLLWPILSMTKLACSGNHVSGFRQSFVVQPLLQHSDAAASGLDFECWRLGGRGVLQKLLIATEAVCVIRSQEIHSGQSVEALDAPPRGGSFQEELKVPLGRIPPAHGR